MTIPTLKGTKTKIRKSSLSWVASRSTAASRSSARSSPSRKRFGRSAAAAPKAAVSKRIASTAIWTISAPRSANTIKQFDLPERAIRPIRIRGALYLQMPLFALCCWRRFDCGGIVDRETLLLPPVQFAIIPVCTGITGSSGFIKTIAPVFRQLPWRILR